MSFYRPVSLLHCENCLRCNRSLPITLGLDKHCHKLHRVTTTCVLKATFRTTWIRSSTRILVLFSGGLSSLVIIITSPTFHCIDTYLLIIIEKMINFLMVLRDNFLNICTVIMSYSETSLSLFSSSHWNTIEVTSTDGCAMTLCLVQVFYHFPQSVSGFVIC